MESIKLAKAKRIEGEIVPPGDKSITHRAIMISSIAKGVSCLHGYSKGEDNIRTLKAFEMMGVEAKQSNGDLLIKGVGIFGLKEPYNVIDAGNSGTTMRLISGILSGQNFLSVITGDESLRSRPMSRIIEPLRLMGAEIFSRYGGFAPIVIKGGRLKPISHRMNIASAQVKSCILFAGIYADGITEVEEPFLSRDHTERMLSYFGVNVLKDGKKVRISGHQQPEAREIFIPGDISSAAFFIIAGLLLDGSELLIRNVGINYTRSGIIDVLREMGANIQVMNARKVCEEDVADIYVKASRLKGIKISGPIIPRIIDEIPILCIAAALAEGETEIRDAAELRVKESDRIATMSSELRKMGVMIEELEDGLFIQGSDHLKGATVYSHNDHRIAMALIIASLIADGGSEVGGIDCIKTSFPTFFDILRSTVTF